MIVGGSTRTQISKNYFSSFIAENKNDTKYRYQVVRGKYLAKSKLTERGKVFELCPKVIL